MTRDGTFAIRSRGQALVEFLIIFPTLLLLVLGAFQFSLLYEQKATLDYATFMAARQGALKGGKKTSIKDGLAAGMTPMFMTKGSDYGDLVRARVIAAIEAFNPLNTKIDVLNPTADAFNEYKQNSDSGTQVPNDNLMYRPTSVQGSAGMNIQDANLLTIQVTYCARLIVPIVDKVIYSLYFGLSGQDVLASEYYAGAGPASGRCATIADNIQSLTNLISSYVPGLDLSGIGAAAASIPTTIPGLNWNVGGYRIPIIATATVRMQSPMTESP